MIRLEVYKKLNELSGLKGSKAKMEWIKKEYNPDDELWQMLQLIFAVQFDPRLVTNLAKKSINKKIKSTLEIHEPYTLYNILLYAVAECTGKDKDIEIMQSFLKDTEIKFGKDVALMIENILIQNLKIGITADTINKALNKKIIYTWNVWKGKVLEDYDKLNHRNVIVTKKFDGYRSSIRYNKVISPNGLEQPLSNFPEIEEVMNKIPAEIRHSFTFDGEMLYNKEPKIDRITRYNKTSSIMGADDIKKDLDFMVFDMVLNSSIEKGISELDTEHRKANLDKLCTECGLKGTVFNYAEILYTGNDYEEIKNLFAQAIYNGDEGLIIQSCDSKYETRKVSDGMWKLKVRNTADLKVVGFEEGKETGKNKGTLGMMLVEYKGSVCGVGSGFKECRNDEKYPIEHTRDWIWNNKDKMIGQIVEVEYDENKDKNGNFNLRHGVFLRWRPDKKEPSYT